MWNPTYKINDRTLSLLEKISELRAKIQSSAVKIPWIPALVRESLVYSAHGSTALEGCTLSIEAINLLLEGKKVSGYPSKHVNMAKNYISAMKWLVKNDKKPEISEKDILQLHKIIATDAVDDGPVGEYRKIDVKAGIYSAYKWKKVQYHINEMIEWLNTKSKEMPAVFSSSLLHLQFVNIHPFRDGNGRCARALATWELYRRGFDTLHIFSLDEILLENRNLYIKNLQRVQVEDYPIDAWLEFMAEAVLETLERVYSRILSTGIKTKIPVSLTVRQEKFLKIIQERRIMNIRDIARAIRTTIPGAHYVIKPLLANGIINKIGHHKTVKYIITR